MALSHILAAITAEADHQIAEATTAHKASLKALAEHHASALHVIAESVQRKKKDRIQQLRQRAEDHTSLLRRHAVLDRKQRIVDEFYDSVIRELSAMSPSQAEKLMTGWAAQLPEGGKILPSKKHEAIVKKIAKGRECGPTIDAKGGFRYESEREDRDYTYEFLVKEILRPATEISVAQQLFSAA